MDEITQIGLLVVGMLLVWTIIRFFLRLTRRILVLGCSLVIMFGLVLVLLAYLR